MKSTTSEPLPLIPLVQAYTRSGVPSLGELHRLPRLGSRFSAVLSASVRLLFEGFLDEASDADLAEALVRFYNECVQPPLHAETLRLRLRMVRHGLAYLLRGQDALPTKMESCLSPQGPYRVPGLGPSFWSALLQGLQPLQHPGWTPAIVQGLRRLGVLSSSQQPGPATLYGLLLRIHTQIRSVEPDLSAVHIDHFLTLVARMSGRDLGWEMGQPSPGDEEDPVARALRTFRRQFPLRELLKERGQALAAGQELLEHALTARSSKQMGEALFLADPVGARSASITWGRRSEVILRWVEKLWRAEEPIGVLAEFWSADPIPRAGLWLPAAILHLRDAQRYFPWNDETRRGYALLDDSVDGSGPPAERYRLFNEGVAWLREHHRLHPLEMAGVLSQLGTEHLEPSVPREGNSTASPRNPSTQRFQGFCQDTFHFLGELEHNNRREWMDQQRERYRFAVREPMQELCRSLAQRYVEPVLCGQQGWALDTEARSGRALTSICKNAYGRTDPYNTTLWITFCRRETGTGSATRTGRRLAAHGRPVPPGTAEVREEVQFFCAVDGRGVRYGVRIGRRARQPLQRVRQQMEQPEWFDLLRQRGVLATCRFAPADQPTALEEIHNPEQLRTWAMGRSLEVACVRAPGDPLLRGDELVGDILLTFDRLLPLYALAVEEKPPSFLPTGAGGTSQYTEGDFRRSTFLDNEWLRRARGLLELKKQLILQGVPGTGKTYVARQLARLLTQGREEAIRLVQFHPAYSYEEFVEGIKVRSVAVEGRHDVTYPVEDGLLCAFAAEAARRPGEPHVLVIDELNRGNLPRIFGELLYLLEYRDQTLSLPYSRRDFQLPTNLYLLATMNASDRSIAPIDQALRRRFSFLEMAPEVSVLAGWLTAHPPRAGQAFTDRVVTLFERLNARLRADLGPQAQMGHSYFMVPDLDESKLRMIWDHHILPILQDHFAPQPGRLAAYQLETLLDGRRNRRRAAEVTG